MGIREGESLRSRTEKDDGREGEAALWRVEELRTPADVRQFFKAKAIAYGHGTDDVERNVHRLEAARPGRNRLFGIKQQGEVVAGVELQRMVRNGEQCVYAWNKFVVATLRGRSMADALHESALREARAMDCAYVFALVDRNTPAAVRSVQKYGHNPSQDRSFDDLRTLFPGSDVYVYRLE